VGIKASRFGAKQTERRGARNYRLTTEAGYTGGGREIKGRRSKKGQAKGNRTKARHPN